MMICDAQIQFNARHMLQKQLRAQQISSEVDNSQELQNIQGLKTSFVPNLSQTFKSLHLASLAMHSSMEESLPSMHCVLSKIGVFDRSSLSMIWGAELQDSQKVTISFLKNV